MTGDQGMAALAGLAGGAATAALVLRPALARAPARLVRVNVDGAPVPAVLGVPLAAGALAGLAAAWALSQPGPAGTAVAVLVVALGLAGAADDLRGAEEVRGFAGHLRALASLRLTGGGIKVLAGAAAALAAGALVAAGRAALEIALLCALCANLVNLLDRAPGRAGKAVLAAALPLVLWGPAGWTLACAGALGALAVLLPADLRAAGMLGDAGSNPLGGLVGLGLGLALEGPARLAALGVVAALNLASERWSFSAAMARNRVLAALDRLGRPK